MVEVFILGWLIGALIAVLYNVTADRGGASGCTVTTATPTATGASAITVLAVSLVLRLQAHPDADRGLSKRSGGAPIAVHRRLVRRDVRLPADDLPGQPSFVGVRHARWTTSAGHLLGDLIYVPGPGQRLADRHAAQQRADPDRHLARLRRGGSGCTPRRASW